MEQDLTWLGIDWDHPPLIQTQRLDAHLEALETLKSQEAIYPCTCSRAEIEQAASAPQAGDSVSGLPRRYPGTCSARSAGEANNLEARGIPFCWRFRKPRDGWPDFQDALRGPVSGAIADREGDFIVWRAAKGNQTGGPSYQLAVAVDDAFQRVTEVVRGEDLLDSTPRQIALMLLLGLPVPAYFHVPLVLDTEGRRLAKRAGSLSVAQLREQGMGAAELIGKLAGLWGLSPIKASLPMKKLIPQFDWKKLKQGPWIWQ
jgi:glutamyl-tRNA synthetase